MDTRSRLLAYLANAGLSTARASANLDALEEEAKQELIASHRRVRDLHERREADSGDGTAYCDLCSNHGDILWPCATIRALDSDNV